MPNSNGPDRTSTLIGEAGQKLVILGYFKHEKLPTLFAPDGSALTGDLVEALAGSVAPNQYAQAGTPTPSAPPPIGRVASVQGNATAVRNGVAVSLNVGDAVYQNDVVQTGSSASAVGVIFGDGTTFNLTANARMVLNEFVYNPAPGSVNSALINLVQGSITFIAGEVARTGDMKVGTPVATMGIRGTAVQVDIDVNNGTDQDVGAGRAGRPRRLVQHLLAERPADRHRQQCRQRDDGHRGGAIAGDRAGDAEDARRTDAGA